MKKARNNIKSVNMIRILMKRLTQSNTWKQEKTNTKLSQLTYPELAEEQADEQHLMHISLSQQT
jgi:hypothetical protein